MQLLTYYINRVSLVTSQTCHRSLTTWPESREACLYKRCSASFHWLRQLCRIRKSLDNGSAAALVHAFVTSRVDYCNALYIRGRRRRLLTSFNEGSMRPNVWSVTHGSSTAVWRHSCAMSSIGWTCQRERELPISWASWCTVVFTVWHLGTLLTNSLQPLTSLHGFVCVPQTDISLLHLAVDSIHTAVGCFRLPVQRSGIRCRASLEIQRVVLTVLKSFS